MPLTSGIIDVTDLSELTLSALAGAISIAGLRSADSSARMLLVRNDTAYTVTLEHDAASASMRILSPASTNYEIAPGGAVSLLKAQSGWLLQISGTGSSGGQQWEVVDEADLDPVEGNKAYIFKTGGVERSATFSNVVPAGFNVTFYAEGGSLLLAFDGNEFNHPDFPSGDLLRVEEGESVTFAARATGVLEMVSAMVEGEDAGTFVESVTGSAVDNTDPQNPVVNAQGYAQGTSFPGAPSTNDKYYRTDRQLLYYYDGTRWLTVNQYFIPFLQCEQRTANFRVFNSVPMMYGFYVEKIEVATFANTPGGADYWSVSIVAGVTTIHSFNTTADATTTWIDHSLTPVSSLILNASDKRMYFDATKNGAPGYLIAVGALIGRMVG